MPDCAGSSRSLAVTRRSTAEGHEFGRRDWMRATAPKSKGQAAGLRLPTKKRGQVLPCRFRSYHVSMINIANKGAHGGDASSGLSTSDWGAAFNVVVVQFSGGKGRSTVRARLSAWEAQTLSAMEEPDSAGMCVRHPPRVHPLRVSAFRFDLFPSHCESNDGSLWRIRPQCRHLGGWNELSSQDGPGLRGRRSAVELANTAWGVRRRMPYRNRQGHRSHSALVRRQCRPADADTKRGVDRFHRPVSPSWRHADSHP